MIFQRLQLLLEITWLLKCTKACMSLVFKQNKRVNDEEQLLRISHSFYFEVKCNNNKKHSFDFFHRKLFLPLMYG